MSVSQYNLQAIEACRTKISGQKGPIEAAGDDLPTELSADMFGTVDSAQSMASAVTGFASTVQTQLSAASTLFNQVDAALDAVGQSVRNTERAGQQNFTAV